MIAGIHSADNDTGEYGYASAVFAIWQRHLELMVMTSVWPGMAEDFGAGRANSVKARTRDSGDLRSTLTEFAPALRCHYPGQVEF